jgi:hypothetical protein
MMERKILVRVLWDPEASVYVAESDDVPGLATEADSLDALARKLYVMIPELLELNDSEFGEDVPSDLLVQQNRSAHARC